VRFMERKGYAVATPRYDEAAAKLAWQRTIEFFNKYLRG